MERYNHFMSVLVIFIIAVVLTACGGSNNSSSSAKKPANRPSGVVSGVSSISSGTVQVYAFNGQKGDSLATGTTDSSGAFSLDVNHADTPVVVCINEGTYHEVANDRYLSTGTNELCAVGKYTSGQPLSLNVTYFTHLGTALASYLVGQGESVSQSVTDANQRIKNMLGFSATDTTPVNISDAASKTTFPTDGDRYGVALAALSQYTGDVSGINFTSLYEVYNSMTFAAMAYDDLSSDGLLDGNGAAGPLSLGTIPVTADTYRHTLAGAMYDVVKKAYNVSGLTAADIKSVADILNNSNDAMFASTPVVPFDTKPTITMVSLPSSLYKGTVLFRFLVTNPYNTPSVSFSVAGNDVPVTLADSVYSASVDTTAFADGDYTLNIYAIDIYGNTKTYSQTVHIFNTAPSTYSGLVYDGLIIQGSLAIYDFTGGVKGAELGTTTTDMNGHYSVDLLAHTGPILLEMTGGHYIEEASGVSVPLQATQNHILRAVAIHNPGTNVAINVTTWTNIAEGLAEYQIAGGTDVTTAINNANAQVNDVLGLDILATEPLDITDSSNAGPLSDGLKYGFMSGALSQWTYNQSVSVNESSIQQSINSINFSMLAYEDVKADGYLDGKGVSGTQLTFGGQSIDANTYRHGLALAMIQMANNSQNKTGLGATDIVGYAKGLNDSTNALFNKVVTIPLDEGGPTGSNLTQSDTSGTITINASVSDTLGLVSTEMLVNGTSVGLTNYPDIPTMANLTATFDSTLFDDCNCNMTVRATSIDGTVTNTALPLQIDNIRFLYLKYFTTTSPTTPSISHLGTFRYNVSDGNVVQVDKDIFNSSTGTTVDSDILDPTGSFLYINGNQVYKLDSVTGNPVSSSGVAYDYFAATIPTHSFLTTSSATYLFTVLPASTNSTIFNVNTYSVDSSGGLASNITPLTVDTGSVTAKSIFIDQVNKVLYLPVTGGFQQYSISPSTGNLTLIPNAFLTTPNPTFGIIFPNNGKFTYVLDMGTGGNSLVDVYSHKTDQTLIYKSSTSVPTDPWSAVFSHDGKHLYVLSSSYNSVTATNDNSISVFDVNESNGSLTEQIGSPYSLNNYWTDYTYWMQIDAGSDYLFVYAGHLLEIPINKTDGSLGTPKVISLPNGGGASQPGSYLSSGAANAP